MERILPENYASLDVFVINLVGFDEFDLADQFGSPALGLKKIESVISDFIGNNSLCTLTLSKISAEDDSIISEEKFDEMRTTEYWNNYIGGDDSDVIVEQDMMGGTYLSINFESGSDSSIKHEVWIMLRDSVVTFFRAERKIVVTTKPLFSKEPYTSAEICVKSN